MIVINNLSNGQEDMFLISIQRENIPEIKILIDGGKSKKRCIDQLNALSFKHLDYIFLTHIDNDHAQGLLKILDSNQDEYKDTIIVYNKFVNGNISYKQAEKFEKMIENREVIVSYKEYQHNMGDLVFLSVEQRKKLQYDKEKIYITFLSPSKDKINMLYSYYSYYKKNSKIHHNNAKIVNSSSIMFIIEYQNTAILMTGDGYIMDIVGYISDLSDNNLTLYPIKKFNLIKIPHHGSKANNEGLRQLLSKTPCEKFIITNEDKGNIKIEDEIKNVLKEKQIYSSTSCCKYTGLDIKITNKIEL